MVKPLMKCHTFVLQCHRTDSIRLILAREITDENNYVISLRLWHPDMLEMQLPHDKFTIPLQHDYSGYDALLDQIG